MPQRTSKIFLVRLTANQNAFLIQKVLIAIFSRRFSQEKSRLQSRLFVSVFLRPPELTKIVLPKVLQNFQKTPKCTCWPKELNQKVSRGIYITVPPLDFFGTLRLFSKKNSPRKGPSSIFWSFATEWMFKNPRGSSLLVFSAL